MSNISNNEWTKLKNKFYTSDEVPSSLNSDSQIVQSWKKSKELGLHPDSKISQLRNLPFQKLTENDHILAQFVSANLQSIWKIFGQQNISLSFINTEYKIIAELHSAEDSESYNDFQVGRIVDPKVFGTVAPNFSLLFKSAVIIRGGEHYLNEFSGYSCASVPVFDGQGQVLGALNVSSRYEFLAKNWFRHLLYQSYILENKFILQNVRHSNQILYFQHSEDLLHTAYSAMIEVDRFGKIVRANQMTLKLLGCEIEDLLDKSLDHFLTLTINTVPIAYAVFFMKSYDNSVFYAEYASVNAAIPSLEKQDVLSFAVKALKVDLPVLIQGETGTGKDYLVKEIHQQLDADIPYIALNCGAIPEQLLESELFGYESGAFTGAKQQGQKGLIELADQGILFLDEIGDLPLSLQVKLLRVLQDKQFYRVGGRKPVFTSFKLVCATHQDLEKLVEEEKFRKDLFYRIRGYNIKLETLSERSDKFELFQKILSQEGVESWDETVNQQFMDYPWLGNIRELIHVVRLSKLLSGSHLRNLSLPQERSSLTAQKTPEEILDLDEFVSTYVQQVFQRKNHNISETAKCLNVSRNTIYKYLKP